MKITLNAKAFAALIAKMRVIIPVKSTYPITECILFNAEGDTLTAIASDTENIAISHMHAAVEVPGRVCIYARTLSDLLPTFPEGDVTIYDEGNSAFVLWESGAAQMPTFNPDDFTWVQPELESGEVLFTDTLNAEALRAAIETAVHFASTDSSRLKINSVLLDFTPDGVFAVATNLASLAKIPVTPFEGTPHEILIPLQQAKDILSFAPDQEATVTLTTSLSHTCLRYEDGDTLRLRLEREKFPPYERLFPRDREAAAVFDRKELLSVLKRQNLFEGSIVRMKFAQGGTVLVESFDRAMETVRGKETLAAEFPGQETAVAFKAEGILGAVAALRCTKIELLPGTQKEPLLIRSSGGETTIKALLMPVRV